MISRDLFKSLYQSLIESAPDLLFSLALLVVFWILGRIVQKIVNKFADQSSPQKAQVLEVLGSFAKVSILLIGLVTALGSLGVNVSALVASIGLSGFALSFAMKDALSNLLAGMMILLYQPFKIHQHIKVTSFEGTVTKISLRFTHLLDNDKEILIPNATLLTNSIVINANNGTKHEE